MFCGGASRGQNAILRGQKSKNLLKMDDFGNFFLDWGACGGGGKYPPLMPPLFINLFPFKNWHGMCCQKYNNSSITLVMDAPVPGLKWSTEPLKEGGLQSKQCVGSRDGGRNKVPTAGPFGAF